MAHFQALEITLQAISSLRAALEPLRRRDPRLHDQIRAAASSIALNIAEGNKRAGRDRRYHFRVAAGSADETRTALRVAIAWGDLSEERVRGTLALLDRVLAMLHRLAESA
jgi:four helix bundle protein